MKLVKISSLYPGLIDAVYQSHPSASNLPYAEQYQLLMSQASGWADFWKQNLESTGDYEVIEIIANARLLQEAWAREQGLHYNPASWLHTILEAQIRHYSPQILFPHDFHLLPPDRIRRIRAQNPSIRRLLFYDGVAYCKHQHFEGADLVLSCCDFILSYYRSHGLRTALFKLGLEPSILSLTQDPGPSRRGAVFSGSISLRPYPHLGRLALLEKLVSHAPIRLLTQIPSNRELARTALQLARDGQWDTLSRYPGILRSFGRLRPLAQAPVYGLAMYQELRNSLVCINAHIDVAQGFAGNSRLFEATGMGCCLLTDHQANIRDLFEPDAEIVTYRSPEECAEKLAYLLQHPDRASTIGRAGQRRTLAQYSLRDEILAVGKTLTQLASP